MRPKITPFLWFDTQAEEAMLFYASVFKHARIGSVTRYGDPGPGQQGKVMTAEFELEGQRFIALNAGPMYAFTEAISFVVDCTSQEEVDEFWEKLTADGGQPGRCGWLKDKYGLSWQIVPAALGELLQDPDPARGQRVMAAMLQMNKIDIARLHEAHAG